MQKMTHPDILKVEWFGSRCEESIYVCARCGQAINEDAEIDVFGRAFCCPKCKAVFYGKTLEV